MGYPTDADFEEARRHGGPISLLGKPKRRRKRVPKIPFSPRGYWPKSDIIWVLFQDSNGDESTKRYCFWFDSRAKARKYRDWVNGHPCHAVVKGPVKFRMAKEIA